MRLTEEVGPLAHTLVSQARHGLPAMQDKYSRGKLSSGGRLAESATPGSYSVLHQRGLATISIEGRLRTLCCIHATPCWSFPAPASVLPEKA